MKIEKQNNNNILAIFNNNIIMLLLKNKSKSVSQTNTEKGNKIEFRIKKIIP